MVLPESKENSAYKAAYAALKEFHVSSDLEALYNKLCEISTPWYCDLEELLDWINQQFDGADQLEDPRTHPAFSLTSSASLLYGIEP